MNTSTNLDPSHNFPWYETPDGTCQIHEPTVIDMGDDRPRHLFFPIHWSESLSILPEAKNQACELNATLVLMLHGEVTLDQMTSLVLELATHCVLPFWVGEENRRTFDSAIAIAVSRHLPQR
ncbi:MAG: hypothetical protein LDL41_26570 [Coleofasciculus sp. S288]|nr:hypothetical protein [Coleofasciculus sp. S288]